MHVAMWLNALISLYNFLFLDKTGMIMYHISQSYDVFVGDNNMLRIIFGDVDDVIYNTSVYFKYNYMREWLLDEEVQDMIRDVDKSIVLGTGAIESPVLGVIAPTDLSGGVKTLILIDKVDDKLFNASNCGDNCAKWLLKMGKVKDIKINLRHIMEFGDDEFEAEIINTGEIVHSMRELIPIAGRYV